MFPFLFDDAGSEFPVVTPWKTTIDHQTAAASTLTGQTESRHEDETTVPCDQGEKRQGDDDESSNDSLSTASSDEAEEIPIGLGLSIRAVKNDCGAFELVRNEQTTTGSSTLESDDECLTYLGQEVELESDGRRKSNKATTTLATRKSHGNPVKEAPASKMDIRVSRQQKIPFNVKANDSGPMSYAHKSTTKSRQNGVFRLSVPRKVDAKVAAPGLNESSFEEGCTLLTRNTTNTEDTSGSRFTLDMLGTYFCRCKADGTEGCSDESSTIRDLDKAVSQCLSSDSSESKDSTMIVPMEIFQNALEECRMSGFCALKDENTLFYSEGNTTTTEYVKDTEAVPRAAEPVGVSGSGEETKREAGVSWRRSTRMRRLRIKLPSFKSRSPFLRRKNPFFRRKNIFRRKNKSAPILDDHLFLEGLKMELYSEINGEEHCESGPIPCGLSDLLEAIIEEEEINSYS